MQDFSLYDYLKGQKTLTPELLDSLKYELDQHVYYFGNHFKFPKKRLDVKNFGFLAQLKRDLFFSIQMFKNHKINFSQKTILSNAYFSINEELRQLHYNVYSPSWWISSDRIVLTTPKLYKLSEEVRKRLKTGSYKELISKSFICLVNDFYEVLDSFYTQKHISALFVPNDVTFFENLSIQLCKRKNIPSFIFLHGLPGRYNLIDENRADYLIVWGEKIKENYVKTGFDPSKIFVSGHPYYKAILNQNFRFSLDNVLVLTKSMNGTPHSDKVVLGDRGNSILYLLQIQNVLKKFGVKNVRFRPHPCENYVWYYSFIDPDFFKLDVESLDLSLKRTSLVIGPTSTVLIESIYFRVNYLVFEPCNSNVDLFNYPLVAPFDGSDSRIPVAKTEEELNYLLKNKFEINPTFFSEYVKTPFDISFVKNLI
jgi:hypothetical protein